MMRTALDQARILSAYLRARREKNFVAAFLSNSDLQTTPSAQRYLSTLWSAFLRTQQGQALRVVEDAKARDPREGRLLHSIRSKLEEGKRLVPNERDVLEELLAPSSEPQSLDQDLILQVKSVLFRLSKRAKSDRDSKHLCDHLQQWLRKQGRR